MSDVAGARVTPGVVLGRTLKWTVLGFFLVFTFVPLLWLVISSFKTNLELTTSPFALPAVWQFQNYVTAFQIAGLFGLFRNSIIISFASTAITLLVTSMAAFVFAREKSPFSQALLSLILAGVLIPIIGPEGIAAAQELTGWLMDGDETVTIRARDPIPLGHKIALTEIAAGESIIKYGHVIGRAIEPIGEGHHVHVHNVKTRRW